MLTRREQLQQDLESITADLAAIHEVLNKKKAKIEQVAQEVIVLQDKKNKLQAELDVCGYYTNSDKRPVPGDIMRKGSGTFMAFNGSYDSIMWRGHSGCPIMNETTLPFGQGRGGMLILGSGEKLQ